jgi:segregation and condensation protein A
MEAKLDMDDVNLDDLMAAARHAMKLIEDRESVDTVVTPPKVTISEKITLIAHTLRNDGSASFMTLLGEDYSKVDVVVTFLALLELVKRFHIRAVQDDLFSDIRIEPTDTWQNGEEFEIEFIE